MAKGFEPRKRYQRISLSEGFSLGVCVPRLLGQHLGTLTFVDTLSPHGPSMSFPHYQGGSHVEVFSAQVHNRVLLQAHSTLDLLLPILTGLLCSAMVYWQLPAARRTHL